MEKLVVPEMKEIVNKSEDYLSKFKSDKGMNISEAKNYSDRAILEAKDNFYTDYSDRIKLAPADSQFGKWDGEKGESKFIPSGETEKGRIAQEKLAEYGLDGIIYKNGIPDFSKCSEATVQIEQMTENRPSNFSQADIKLSEQWNLEERLGRSDWKQEDVDKYRQDNRLIWHECSDTKTMNLISGDIHPDGKGNGIFTHSGGVAECRIRDNKSVGGGFDE